MFIDNVHDISLINISGRMRMENGLTKRANRYRRMRVSIILKSTYKDAE